MKLKIDLEVGIHVTEMKDGDIAVITKWAFPHYHGKIVVRFGHVLYNLGSKSEERWDDIFIRDSSSSKGCFVKILQPGTELVV